VKDKGAMPQEGDIALLKKNILVCHFDFKVILIIKTCFLRPSFMLIRNTRSIVKVDIFRASITFFVHWLQSSFESAMSLF
jgi:hypothetical protein